MQTHSRRARGRAAFRCSVPPVDALEPRRLLSGTLTVTGTANADTITLGVNASGGIHVVLNNVATDYAAGAYSALQVNSGAGADTINLQAVPPGVAVTLVNSGGTDSDTIGNLTNGTGGINGSVNLATGGGLSHLIVDDRAGAAATVTLSASASTGRIDGIAPNPISFDVAATADVVVKTSDALGNTVNLLQTSVPTTIQARPTSSFNPSNLIDRINIGDSGKLDGILGAVAVSGGFVFCTADDSQDTIARHVTVDIANGVHGLAPADLRGVGVIQTPAVAGNEIDVLGSSIRIVGSTPVSVGHDLINIGSAGSIANVGQVYIENPVGTDTVTIDDSADSQSSGLTFATATSPPGALMASWSGFSRPLQVFYLAALGGQITINTGSATNGVGINSLSAFGPGTLDLNLGSVTTTTVVSGTPAGSNVNIYGQGGTDTLQVVSGSSPVAGNVNLSNPAGSVSLSVDDRSDSVARNVTIDAPAGAPDTAGSIEGLCPGDIHYDAAQVVGAITLWGGSGNDNYNIVNTPAYTNPGAERLHLEVGIGHNAVNVSGLGANAYVSIFDFGSSTEFTTDFGPGHISDGSSLHLYGGSTDTLVVRGATAGDSFSGAGGIIQHGNARIYPGTISSLRLQTGAFREVYAGALELDGADTTLIDGGIYFLAALTINAAKMAIGGHGGQGTVQALSISNGGQLDITNSQLQISFPVGVDPIAATRSYLQSGYDAGAWDGPGIISSTLDSAHGLLAVPAGTNGSLVRSARVGDTNLDRQVNFADLLTVAQNYGRTNESWSQGDFDYDGTVGFNDLLKLAQNYGTFGSAAPAAVAPLTPITDTDAPSSRRRRRA